MLEWLTNSDISDAQMAAALALPTATYGRRKDAADFPSYEELAEFADYFNVSAKALQIEFGLRGEDEIEWLDDDELRQYRALSDDAHPFSAIRRRGVITRATGKRTQARKMAAKRSDVDLPLLPRGENPPL